MPQEEIDRERISGAYRDSIIASVEHDEQSASVGSDRNLREAYQERGKQLDENEASLKEQYGASGCEEQTGMSADAFRHQTISDYTHHQLTTQEQDAQSAQSYWNENQGAVAEGNAQEASDQYWNSQSSAENGNTVVKDGNLASASNESSAANDLGAGADNSVSNENSL